MRIYVTFSLFISTSKKWKCINFVQAFEKHKNNLQESMTYVYTLERVLCRRTQSRSK